MEKKPNIFIIVTDQVAWKALPFYGNKDVKIPNIDRICEGGMGFGETYCSYPMCQPSRASFWSGLYPHQTNVISNGRNWPVADLPKDTVTLGTLFRDNGYKAIHFGKTHDAGALNGFECVEKGKVMMEEESKAWPLNQDSFSDRDTTIKAERFLKEYDGEKPFIMVADYVNPHNICGWVGAFRNEHEDVPIPGPLPPLPENFEFDDIKNRPLPVQYICCSHNRQAQAAGWKPESFQYYLAAYYHYLEMVDREIGVLLDAFEKRKDAKDTLLVFMSDHGDSMAARGRVTKQVDFYEEDARVPFIFKGPGVKPNSTPLSGAPVSLLDLVPTLCSYAGITYPETLFGKDLTESLKGGPLPNREYVASEWHTEWGFTVSPGRMIRDNRYKYILYLEGHGEELYDLKEDPFEKKNVAADSNYQEVLDKMRTKYRHFIEETGDNFETLSYKADKKWRSHPVGYQNHKGLAAPAAYDAAHGIFK